MSNYFLKFQKFCYLLFVVTFVISCDKEPTSLTSVKDAKKIIRQSMSPNQSITWEEEIIDSLFLPSSMSGEDALTKLRYINKNTSKWVVTVTVPDSNVKNFRIERVLTQIAGRDTVNSPSNQVWKTVSYGNSFTAYDKNNNVMHSSSSGDNDTSDINSLPLMISSSDILSDSTVSILKNDLTSNGYTVTQSGNIITASITKTESGVNWIQTSTFEKDYFSMVSTSFYKNGLLWSTEAYSYTTVGSYRIATSFISTTYNQLDPDGVTALNGTSFTVPTEYKNFKQITINNLSNILIP